MSHGEDVIVHESAIVEPGVRLGRGTRVWDNAHIRRDAVLGEQCIVGEKTYIAYGVRIGSFCKLNAAVYVCAGVTIEDFCMLSAHVVFTNDRYPRAGNVELTGLETSDPTDETLDTRVGRGVTIGANATIGPGIALGRFAMVGMGSVVTRDVPPFALVIGNPARRVGWVCACGHPLADGQDACSRCHREYAWRTEGPAPRVEP